MTDCRKFMYSCKLQHMRPDDDCQIHALMLRINFMGADALRLTQTMLGFSSNIHPATYGDVQALYNNVFIRANMIMMIVLKFPLRGDASMQIL